MQDLMAAMSLASLFKEHAWPDWLLFHVVMYYGFSGSWLGDGGPKIQPRVPTGNAGISMSGLPTVNTVLDITLEALRILLSLFISSGLMDD